MDDLVDVFYYDFILTKIIELYRENASIEKVLAYLKLATVLSRKIREDNLKVDAQIYTKEIYIKTIQAVKHYVIPKDLEASNTAKNTVEKSSVRLIECIRAASKELPELMQNNDFLKLCVCSFVIYSKYTTFYLFNNGSNTADNFNEEVDQTVKFIKNTYNVFNSQFVKDYQNIFKNFSEELISRYLNTIELGNPVMKKFTEQVKNKIDEQLC